MGVGPHKKRRELSEVPATLYSLLPVPGKSDTLPVARSRAQDTVQVFCSYWAGEITPSAVTSRETHTVRLGLSTRTTAAAAEENKGGVRLHG
eukprot:CAMPEP_0175254590 /NCGR_PEP_ID=MMETSP0093-20121207/37268_1 /TAXON_ID=311494 /ORGANISM="Alexandrium monilatum, Strain CCMP3105" /LENGTH=91 /DNA_ID=CAMNT_0016548913 /DNA_START=83 /DNA_END=355 /DNA_ORIENTATION=+